MKLFASILLPLIALAQASVAFADHETGLPPNEMGKIMVLMYHKIYATGTPAKNDDYSITAEEFQRQLNTLYEKGYYLINLVDLIDLKFNVPAGKTPVVLTFDDGAPGQFNKIGGEWDPKSGVGMIQAMHSKHPDFGMAGSFYLNPVKNAREMLNEMVAMGFELGNHTVTHPQLSKLSQEGVEKEIALLQDWIDQQVPGYHVRTMAMPFGIYPTVDTWAADGEYKGIRYHNEALLKVGAEPTVSPFSIKFRPLHISRVRGTAQYFDQAVQSFDHYGGRFISDGDATVATIPASRKAELAPGVASHLKVEIR